MASNTERLGLLKKDPLLDGADTFNIETMLNENWNKIDKLTALIDPVTGKLLPGQENPVDVSDIQQKLTAIEKSVGMLTALETVEKTNLVAAINEIRQALATHKADIASQELGKGASLVGVNDVGNLFTATTVEGALKEAITQANAAFTLGNSRKTELVDSLLSLDGSLPITHESSWEDVFFAMSNVKTVKTASGTININTGSKQLVTGLGFKPTIVKLKRVDKPYDQISGYVKGVWSARAYYSDQPRANEPLQNGDFEVVMGAAGTGAIIEWFASDEGGVFE